MVHDRAVWTRRRFLQGSLTLAGLGLLHGCGVVPSATPTPAKVPRIGWLGASRNEPVIGAFRQGLGELGYVVGRTIVIEERYHEGQPRRNPELAAELVRLEVDAIVTGSGNPGIRAAREATSTIPIVMGQSGVDQVAAGLVANLARPGGNVTGLTALSKSLSQKRLELLMEAVPAISVRLHHQAKDCAGPRADHPAGGPAAGHRGHPVGKLGHDLGYT